MLHMGQADLGLSSLTPCLLSPPALSVFQRPRLFTHYITSPCYAKPLLAAAAATDISMQAHGQPLPSELP